MKPVLWHIRISHYSEKVRWALDHEGVAYTGRTPPPGSHMSFALWLTVAPYIRRFAAVRAQAAPEVFRRFGPFAIAYGRAFSGVRYRRHRRPQPVSARPWAKPAA